VPASFCLEVLLKVEVIEGVHAGCCLEKYIAALTAVSPVWSPFGNVFLASKTHAAVATIPRLNGDEGFIKKLH